MLVGPLGTGGGLINLITNGSADDASVSIFIPYADAAASRPVDGTGGSPAVTTSITTTAPLAVTKSFLLTKPASNTQGQGWSVPFSVDLTYRAKALQISVDYIVNSGTFAAGSTTADSDVVWYLYDITNSLLIEPSSIKMLSNSSTLSDKFQATFQTSLTGSSYRLIAHCATTSASAYELKVDNVSVSPSLYVYGTPVTVWREFTPTFTGMGTVTNIKAFWRRVGQNLEVYGRATTGTTAASGATISFSSLGVNIDTSLIVSDATRGQVFGEVQRENADSATFSIGAHSTFTNYVYISDSAFQGGLRDSDGNAILASGEKFSFKFSVPILGWSASAQQSDNYEGREISGQVTITSNLSMTANNPIIFPVITKDSVGSYNVSTGQVRIPSAGEYEFTLTEAYNNTSIYFLLYKNGVATALLSVANAAGVIANSYIYKGNFLAGDLVDVRPSNATNSLQYLAYSSGSGYIPKFSWKKNQGSQAISASEKVFVSYTCTTGQSITSGSNVTILFNNKLNDSHGVYNTSNGRLTLPRAGVGYINAICTMSSAVAGTYWVTIFKNGSLYKNGVQIAATTWGSSISTQVEGLAGDYFEIRVNQSGTTRGLDTTAANNHFDFRMD